MRHATGFIALQEESQWSCQAKQLELQQYNTTLSSLHNSLHGQHAYRWISWHIFTMGTGGHYITMLLMIGQYPHHMTLCPPVAIVKNAMESNYTEWGKAKCCVWLLNARLLGQVPPYQKISFSPRSLLSSTLKMSRYITEGVLTTNSLHCILRMGFKASAGMY